MADLIHQQAEDIDTDIWRQHDDGVKPLEERIVPAQRLDPHGLEDEEAIQ
jgi:hypothetical protein